MRNGELSGDYEMAFESDYTSHMYRGQKMKKSSSMLRKIRKKKRCYCILALIFSVVLVCVCTVLFFLVVKPIYGRWFVYR